MIARAFKSARHPILAQIVPIRRCNLACAYCNEYDHASPPVPAATMARRIDRLAALGTTIIEISGGEPLLHPELDVIISRIRRHGILAGLLTNGCLLTERWIDRLNRAGLDHLQISVDNVRPDEVSTKSLLVLDGKLRLLARLAEFDVNINCVVGGVLPNANDALLVAERARELGFTSTVGLIHNGSGQLVPLDPAQQRAYDAIARPGASFYSFARHNPFQRNLARGLPNQWRCRAGSRYLYVCEDGLVHWCSPQRGHPGVRLDQYTPAHLDREFHTTKPCAPFCTVSCVHRVALLDELRQRPLEALADLTSAQEPGAPAPPVSVKLLRWMFVTGPQRRLFRRAVLRVLRVE